MFALINELTMHYRIDAPPESESTGGETGSAPSGPALVFINSLGCDLRIWDGVVPALMDRFHVLRYDKRGHGLTDAPPGPYTIREHSQDLAGLLDALAIDTAVLVGISVGGLVAMDFALLHPERVRGLVLCDTAPNIGTAGGWTERIRAVNERGLEEMAETIMARWFAPGFAQSNPAMFRGWRNMLARTPQEGYTATCAALMDADLRESIGAITAPTLAVCGAADLVVTPAQTREWAACLPGAWVKVIEGAAHLPCIEQPQALLQVMEPFLQEAANGRR